MEHPVHLIFSLVRLGLLWWCVSGSWYMGEVSAAGALWRRSRMDDVRVNKTSGAFWRRSRVDDIRVNKTSGSSWRRSRMDDVRVNKTSGASWRRSHVDDVRVNKTSGYSWRRSHVDDVRVNRTSGYSWRRSRMDDVIVNKTSGASWRRSRMDDVRVNKTSGASWRRSHVDDGRVNKTSGYSWRRSHVDDVRVNKTSGYSWRRSRMDDVIVNKTSGASWRRSRMDDVRVNKNKTSGASWRRSHVDDARVNKTSGSSWRRSHVDDVRVNKTSGASWRRSHMDDVKVDSTSSGALALGKHSIDHLGDGGGKSGEVHEGPRERFWWKDLGVSGAKHVWEREVLNNGHSRKGLQQRRFVPFGPEPHFFVRFSAYRHRLNSFFVLGLGVHKAVKKGQLPVNGCMWIPQTNNGMPLADREVGKNSSAIYGTTLIRRVGEHHERIYEGLVVECRFPSKVGAQGEGGFLFLLPSAGAVPASELKTPVEDMDQALLVHHEESPNMTRYDPVPEGDLHPMAQIEFVHCGPPMFNKLVASSVADWYHFHDALLAGKVMYYVYNAGGVDAKIRQALEPFVARGIMEVDEVQQQHRYNTWAQNQLILLNDCLHRSRYFARWIFNFDLDEFLVMRPPQFLSSVLAANSDKMTISFATWLYSPFHCMAESGTPSKTWLVERMVYRREYPACFRNVYPGGRWNCQGSHGRRKWIINPYLTAAVNVHEMKDVHALKKGYATMVLDARQAWLAHFRGVLLRRYAGQHCSNVLDRSNTSVVHQRAEFWQNWQLEREANDIRQQGSIEH